MNLKTSNPEPVYSFDNSTSVLPPAMKDPRRAPTRTDPRRALPGQTHTGPQPGQTHTGAQPEQLMRTDPDTGPFSHRPSMKLYVDRQQVGPPTTWLSGHWKAYLWSLLLIVN